MKKHLTKKEAKKLKNILSAVKRNNIYADWNAIIYAEEDGENVTDMYFNIHDIICTDIDNTTLIKENDRERLAAFLSAKLSEKFFTDKDSSFHNDATFLSRQDIDDFLELADNLIKEKLEANKNERQNV